MKNKILQFIKKIHFCLLLKKYNLLHLLKDLRSFKYVLKFFSYSENNNTIRDINKFLAKEKSFFWDSLYDELSARRDLFPQLKPRILKKNKKLSANILLYKSSQPKPFYYFSSIIKEIIEIDYPQFIEQYNFFTQRLEQFSDSRLYGAELEKIQSSVSGISQYITFEINWNKSHKHKLYAYLEGEATYSSKIPITAQKNLSKTFAKLFFEKKQFISAWRGIAYNKNNQICFLDFDAIYQTNQSLYDYAIKSIKEPQTPQTVNEFKLQRAINILQLFCTNINIYSDWKKYAHQLKYETAKKSENKLLKNLQHTHLDISPYKKNEDNNSHAPLHLLNKRRHNKTINLKKTSVNYWFPLLLMALIAYYFL